MCSSNWKSIHLPPILRGEHKKTFELAPSSRQVLLPFLIQAHSGPHTLAGEKLNFHKKRGLVNMKKNTTSSINLQPEKKLQ